MSERRLPAAAVETAAPAAVAPAAGLDDLQAEAPAFAADGPRWPCDAIAVSQRVRAILAALRPVAVRVLTFWDHALRSIRLGDGRCLELDAAGSYRLRCP